MSCKQNNFFIGETMMIVTKGIKVSEQVSIYVKAVQCLSALIYLMSLSAEFLSQLFKLQRGAGMTEGTNALPCHLYAT